MVTRLPNHWWANSWATTAATLALDKKKINHVHTLKNLVTLHKIWSEYFAGKN